MESLAALYGRLAHLHGAGIGWPKALALAQIGRPTPAWAKAQEAVAGGKCLSDALAHLAPPVDVAGLRAGEASGRVEEVLRTLARRHEEEERLARERRAGLAYPLLLAHVAALLLPLPDLLAGRRAQALLWCLAVLVPTYAYLALARRARRAAASGATPFSTWVSRLLTSRADVEEADARALAALAWLDGAGVPWNEALPLAARAGAGGRAAEDLREGGRLVGAGRPLEGAWRRLPPEIAVGLRSGETAGQFAEACERAARSLEESARFRRKGRSARLVALFVLGLGLVIGARIVSFYASALSYPRFR